MGGIHILHRLNKNHGAAEGTRTLDLLIANEPRYPPHHSPRSGAGLAGIAAGWLPWMLYLDRTIFTFYTVVYVPFLVMALTLTLGAIAHGLCNKPRWIPAAIIGGYLFAVVAAAWWFYPIWTAEVIPYEAWRARMWLPTWI